MFEDKFLDDILCGIQGRFPSIYHENLPDKSKDIRSSEDENRCPNAAKDTAHDRKKNSKVGRKLQKSVDWTDNSGTQYCH